MKGCGEMINNKYGRYRCGYISNHRGTREELFICSKCRKKDANSIKEVQEKKK